MQSEQPFSQLEKKGAGARLRSAAFSNPTQIGRQPAIDRNENYFRHFVWMQRAQLFLERFFSIFGRLEKNDHFAGGLNFFFPAINRVDGRQDVRACREVLFDQCLPNATGCFRVRKSADCQQDLIGHFHASTSPSKRSDFFVCLTSSFRQIQPPPMTTSA